MKPIWQTPVREITDEHLKSMAWELCLIRSWELAHVETARLFSFVQSVFQDVGGRTVRINQDCAVPGGILRTKIEKLDAQSVVTALEEMGSWKQQPMRLEQYANRSVLVFLNDYFSRRTPKVHQFYRPI